MSIPAAVNNTVDVTVNVGAPVLMPSERRMVVRQANTMPEIPWHETSPAIILALVLFFPVGLILLWKSDWTEDTKWSVTGLLLWPLWIRTVLRQHWPNSMKVLASVALVLGYAAMFTRLSGAALLLVGLPAFAWTLWQSRSVSDVGSANAPAREGVRMTLDRCHDVIAEIESTIALDLLPAKSWLRDRYIQALEIRQEAANLLSSTDSRVGVENAREKAERALSLLIEVKQGLPEYQTTDSAR